MQDGAASHKNKSNLFLLKKLLYNRNRAEIHQIPWGNKKLSTVRTKYNSKRNGKNLVLKLVGKD